MNANRVLLMQLSERTSAKGNRYLSGWLGKASVVAFQAEAPDKFGNPVWEVFVSTPEPRPEQQQSKPEPSPEQRPQSPPPGDARLTRPRGDGWRGSRYVRPANGAARAPEAGHKPFYDDSLEDIGRG